MPTISLCATFVHGLPESKENLSQIVSEHKEWLEDHNKGRRACLTNKNLKGADLSGVDLSYADLSGSYMANARMAGTKLTNAILDGTSLDDADLSKANLDYAHLFRATITHACLEEASMKFADMRASILWDSNFKKANLSGAILTYSELCDSTFEAANLSYSDLYSTNMDNAVFTGAIMKSARLKYASFSYYADFIDADLTGVDFSECDLNKESFVGATGFHPHLKCPEEGSFVAWKKCRDDRIVKLLIPETAQRTGISVYSCRASEAIVLDILNQDGDSCDKAVSCADKDFIYPNGGKVYPKNSFDNQLLDDGSGIHFFLTRTEAELYEYLDNDSEDENADSSEEAGEKVNGEMKQ